MRRVMNPSFQIGKEEREEWGGGRESIFSERRINLNPFKSAARAEETNGFFPLLSANPQTAQSSDLIERGPTGPTLHEKQTKRLRGEAGTAPRC